MQWWRNSAAVWLAALMIVATVTACSGSRGEEAESDDAQATEESAAGTASAEDGGDDDTDNGDTADGEDQEEESKGVPVEVVTIARGPIESVLRYTTNLEAESAVTVFSEASRRVRSLEVEEGDEVRRGQVLLRLQDDEQQTALARAKSQLDKAELEFRRQQRLFEQQLISEQVFNEASYELEQMQLAYRDAQRGLSYTAVRAPISGTVTVRHVNVGDHVSVNQQLFEIIDFDSIVALVYVPEKELASLRTDGEARILAAARGNEPRQGSIKRIAPVVDPRSGTVKVTVDVPRSEELLPGMYVSVELVTSRSDDAILVPKKALIYDADQVFLYRVAGDKAERLLLKPALEDRDNIMPDNGVEPGDLVVIAGQAGLKDGSKIDILGDEPEEEEAASGDEVEA